jgi:hypothetical protein
MGIDDGSGITPLPLVVVAVIVIVVVCAVASDDDDNDVVLSPMEVSFIPPVGLSLVSVTLEDTDSVIDMAFMATANGSGSSSLSSCCGSVAVIAIVSFAVQR